MFLLKSNNLIDMISDKKKLSLKINEIFHNFESIVYDERHPEILKEETLIWQKISEKYITDKNNIKILDIGSGTGFVGSVVVPYLKKNAEYISSDISEGMLNQCKKKLSNFENCSLKFLKLEEYKINLPDNFCDFIIMNSVLHHIPDIEKQFNEINRVLKKNGLFIINHEPNIIFFESFLYQIYKILDMFYSPKKYISSFLEIIGLYKIIKRIYSVFFKQINNNENIYYKVNSELLKLKVIDKPLSIEKIDSLVDIHTHNNLNDKTGFNVFDVMKINKKFKLIELNTYNHISLLSYKFKKIDSFFKKRNYYAGANFCLILKK